MMLSIMSDAICRAVSEAGGSAALARSLGVSTPTVSQWLSGQRPVPPRQAARIEAIVAGKIRADDLCPRYQWDRNEAGDLTGYRVRLDAEPARAA